MSPSTFLLGTLSLESLWSRIEILFREISILIYRISIRQIAIEIRKNSFPTLSRVNLTHPG